MKWLQLVFLFSSPGSSDGVGRRLHSAPGLGLSKTPTAEMEHSLHEASIAPASQVVVTLGAKVLGTGWCVGRNCGEMWVVGLVVRQRHGNGGLLEENTVYDWAAFEWRGCHMGTTFQIYQVFSSESYPSLSHIPGDRVCAKTIVLVLCDCLYVSVYLKASPCQGPGRECRDCKHDALHLTQSPWHGWHRGRRPRCLPTILWVESRSVYSERPFSC